MLDILGLVATLKRPKLLGQAARIGARHYQREKVLHRILKTESLPRSGEALVRLIEVEAGLNAARVGQAAEYDVTAHVETLIAIAGEAALFEHGLSCVSLT